MTNAPESAPGEEDPLEATAESMLSDMYDIMLAFHEAELDRVFPREKVVRYVQLFRRLASYFRWRYGATSRQYVSAIFCRALAELWLVKDRDLNARTVRPFFRRAERALAIMREIQDPRYPAAVKRYEALRAYVTKELEARS